jgi:hypothetical protein
LTFDLDAADDPTHGSQQLSLSHSFYEQYQYLPLLITCAENDQIVMLSLRHGAVVEAAPHGSTDVAQDLAALNGAPSSVAQGTRQ